MVKKLQQNVQVRTAVLLNTDFDVFQCTYERINTSLFFINVYSSGLTIDIKTDDTHRFFDICLDQQIDGLGIELLATKGTTSQLERCGLDTVGSQLKFQRLVLSQLDVKKTTESPVTILSSRKKPSKKELQECTEVNKRVYNAK